MIKNKGKLPKSIDLFEKEKNEELSKLAKRYVQNNSSVKGKPNMTTNTTLLLRLSLDFPGKFLCLLVGGVYLSEVALCYGI